MPYSDPVKRAEYKRQHYEANREAYLERARQHYADNREQKIEYARRYQKANPEAERERKRQYKAANREKERERNRKYHAAHPEKARERGRRYDTDARYGMRPGGRAQMHKDQDGRCYLCGDPLQTGRWTHVDHDHSCCPRGACDYCRRGLACHACNLLIGLAREDPDRLRRIAGNLEIAQAAVVARMTQKPVQGSLEEAL